MDTWQIAEKLFNFCKEKYPDLDWAWNYSHSDINVCRSVSSIFGTYSLFKLELEICSDKKQQEVFSYKEETTYDYIQGWIDVDMLQQKKSRLFWSGNFKVKLNHNKDSELEFTAATRDEWDYDIWTTVKKARKMLIEIFGFIEDEIQK